jgi:hypothetical protein
MKRKNPKYTHGFVDHDGKPRFYLRVPGRKKQVPLPGLPWSPEFMEARQAALQGDWTSPELGASRTRPGTVNAALVSYYQSSAFKKTEDGIMTGDPSRIRTCNPRSRNPLLYPVELWDRWGAFIPPELKNQHSHQALPNRFRGGRDKG